MSKLPWRFITQKFIHLCIVQYIHYRILRSMLLYINSEICKTNHKVPHIKWIFLDFFLSLHRFQHHEYTLPGLLNLSFFWLFCLICTISTLLSSLNSTLCRDDSAFRLHDCLHPTLLCEWMHWYRFWHSNPTMRATFSDNLTSTLWFAQILIF